MPTYFWDGSNHFIFGIVVVALFSAFIGRPDRWTPGFIIGFLLGSSSVFFIPTHLPFLGKNLDQWYQFAHYPLPDWDILIFGGEWHRSFFTHSCLIPILLFFPKISRDRLLHFIFGLTLAVSSHLIWDGFSSYPFTKVVVYPGAITLPGIIGSAWLVGNGASLLVFGRFVLRDFIRR